MQPQIPCARLNMFATIIIFIHYIRSVSRSVSIATVRLLIRSVTNQVFSVGITHELLTTETLTLDPTSPWARQSNCAGPVTLLAANFSSLPIRLPKRKLPCRKGDHAMITFVSPCLDDFIRHKKYPLGSAIKLCPGPVTVRGADFSPSRLPKRKLP